MTEDWASRLGQVLGIADLRADALGEVALRIGERVVSLVSTPAGLFLSTAVGHVPAHDRTRYLKDLLLQNGELVHSGYSFGVDPATKEVLLLLRAPATAPESLRASIEDLVRRANQRA